MDSFGEARCLKIRICIPLERALSSALTQPFYQFRLALKKYKEFRSSFLTNYACSRDGSGTVRGSGFRPVTVLAPGGEFPDSVLILAGFRPREAGNAKEVMSDLRLRVTRSSTPVTIPGGFSHPVGMHTTNAWIEWYQ